MTPAPWPLRGVRNDDGPAATNGAWLVTLLRTEENGAWLVRLLRTEESKVPLLGEMTDSGLRAEIMKHKPGASF